MTDQNIFNDFRVALRSIGSPKGLTEGMVEEEIRAQYTNLFAAIGEFDSILQFQDPDMGLKIYNERADRILYLFGFVAVLSTGHGTLPFPIKLTLDTIRATQQPLDTMGPASNGTWPAGDEEEFIKALSKSIIGALGIPAS